jgi:hypothetical protein
MPLPTVFLIHAVTVQTRMPKQKLLYDGGTALFTEGKTICGSISTATGVIDEVSGTAASGYLVLSTVSGTFQDDEPLTETTGTGAAVANGTQSDYKGVYNKPDYYYQSAASTVNIRLGSISGLPGSSAGAHFTERGEIISNLVSALIPSSTVIAEFTNRVVTTVTGYAGTYDVKSVAPVYEPVGGLVSHYMAILQKVP